MKITRKEWRVLQAAIHNFCPQGTPANCEKDKAVADNLLARFEQELTFPKGWKP